ncbi:MAG: flavodoxin domain-containing protein [Acidobacteria bacterium]|jgi:menaquinone-dependent protoporphyrinogen oxidase|nr:flavodoxin domain-containing protein [Acidobacteriota bacterium]
MKVILIGVLAVLFCGLCILAVPAEGQKSVVIVYGSRYGSTARTAEWIAEGMAGKAVLVAAKEAGDLSGYEKVVLGSGIYGDMLHADMLSFLEKRGDEVRGKLLALFVVCGAPPDYASGYLEKFAARCGAKPQFARAFGGWMKKELLSPEDFKGLEGYYKSVNQPYENYDRTDKAKCLEFARLLLGMNCPEK